MCIRLLVRVFLQQAGRRFGPDRADQCDPVGAVAGVSAASGTKAVRSRSASVTSDRCSWAMGRDVAGIAVNVSCGTGRSRFPELGAVA